MPPRPLRAVDDSGQTGFDEKVIEDATLAESLEQRQVEKSALSEQRKAYKEADAAAKHELEKLELPDDTAVRVGRFRITRRTVPGRVVSFEMEERSQLSIAFLGED
jgi:hypothetical protein